MLDPSLIDDYIGISVTGLALTGMVLKLISLWANIVDPIYLLVKWPKISAYTKIIYDWFCSQVNVGFTFATPLGWVKNIIFFFFLFFFSYGS